MRNMNDDKTLDAALCADVLAAAAGAEAAQAAPAEGKREYVPPRMQVIPLGPQRLLATSGVVGPPVQVSINMLHGVDYYYKPTGDNPFYYEGPLSFEVKSTETNPFELSRCSMPYDGTLYHNGGTGADITTSDWEFGCGDVVGGASFLANYAAKAQAMRDYVDECTDCANFIFVCQGLSTARCGSGLYDTPGLTPAVAFAGADWDVQDFFSNARFDACSDEGTFSGTYDGRRFEGTIEY